MADESSQLPFLGYAPEDIPKMTSGVISRTRSQLRASARKEGRQARPHYTGRGASLHRQLSGSSHAQAERRLMRAIKHTSKEDPDAMSVAAGVECNRIFDNVVLTQFVGPVQAE